MAVGDQANQTGNKVEKTNRPCTGGNHTFGEAYYCTGGRQKKTTEGGGQAGKHEVLHKQEDEMQVEPMRGKKKV